LVRRPSADSNTALSNYLIAYPPFTFEDAVAHEEESLHYRE
jgi:hypothetical protein